MEGVQAAALLGSFLAENGERIAKRAGKSLKHELAHGLSWQERRAAIPSRVGELGSLLLERGLDAPQLWGEVVRPQGARYFEERRDVGDLVREVRVLQETIIDEWNRKAGPMDPAVTSLLALCMGEGAASAVAGFVHRLRSEQFEFRESALIETILTHLDEGILLVEADGTFSFATRPALDLLGDEMSSALGGPITGQAVGEQLERLQALTLDGAPFRQDSLPATIALRSGQPPEPVMIRVRHGEEERVLELGAIPIWIEGHERASVQDLRGVINTVRDRTEDYRKSEQIARANQELAELHTRLLHRSRSQAMGELATGAAHALNNLLNAMTLRLRLLRESPTGDKIDALERSLSDIAALVARLQQLGAQRTGAEPGAAEIGEVDLDAVLREAIVLVRPEARRAGEGEVRLRTELRGAPPVRANAGELREILVSLMLYAREQLAQGGELSIESSLPEAGGACCRLLYRTAGRAPLSAQAWFEPFLGTEAPASIALVASSARESLSRWGGSLEARSTADGAEFLLTFAPAKPKEARPQPMPEIAQPKVSRVLVVDDDLDNAAMLAEVLTSEGHQADTATTGAEALAKWRSGRYDVALVDFLMPDVSGIELSKQLSALQPQARLALVTGWELDAEQRKAAPVHAVFRKPVDLEQLLSFLNPAPRVEERPSP